MVGRSPFADVVIADPSVAPHHAEIVVTSGGRLHLTDCATPGGTWRLGPAEDGDGSSEWRPVRQAFVREDEPLRLGEYRCVAGQLVRSLRPGGELPGWTSEAAGQEGRGGPRRALGGRVERDAVTGEIVRRRP